MKQIARRRRYQLNRFAFDVNSSENPPPLDAHIRTLIFIFISHILVILFTVHLKCQNVAVSWEVYFRLLPGSKVPDTPRTNQRLNLAQKIFLVNSSVEPNTQLSHKSFLF